LAQLSINSVAVLPAKETELRESETKAYAIDHDEKEKEAVEFADNKDIKNSNRQKKDRRHQGTPSQELGTAQESVFEMEAAKENESGDGEGRQDTNGSERQDKNVKANVKSTKAHAPSSPTSTLAMATPNGNPQHRFEFDIKYNNTFLDKLTAVLAGANTH
jgi:hypothetical protein